MTVQTFQEKLSNLQVQKDDYKATSLTLDKEKNVTLANKDKIVSPIQTIQETITKLQEELASLTPHHKAAN